MSYLPCELHCHTVHSDGQFQVKELLNAANDDHLSLIALTDHNTTSGHKELDDSILPAIRGVEWTTYFGHMLVLGAKSKVDWRDAKPDNIDEKICQVKDAGGVVGVAHPYQIGSPICTGGRWEFNVNNWDNVDFMEIFHEDIALDSKENRVTSVFWKSLLDKGHKIAATYSRDWHCIEPDGHFGCTYINIDGKPDEEKALDAIKNGRTVFSTGAKFFFVASKDNISYNIGDTVDEGNYSLSFFVDLHAREKDSGDEALCYKTIKIVTNGNETVLEVPYGTISADIALKKNQWYIAELWGTVDGEGKVLAITSPIYCEY